MKISFINGEFLPHEKCLVHIEDRGFQFADAVYEVVLFHNNKLIDNEAHLARLFASLQKLNIKIDKNKEELTAIFLELFKKNNLTSGSVYLQITRGSSPRGPYFPTEYIPTITATVSLPKEISATELENGLSAITFPDIRWQRCDIKTTALLGSSMAKQKAKAENVDEAIFVRDGFVTEASFANIFIVDKEDRLITRNADNNILCGITRNRIIDLARQNQIEVLEEKFSVERLKNAKEVFATSSTLLIRPITKVDNKIISTGKMGDITRNLTQLYNNFINQNN